MALSTTLSSEYVFFFSFRCFYLPVLGPGGGDKTYKIEPPDPITLSKKSVLQRIHRYKNKHDLKIKIMLKKGGKGDLNPIHHV